jgi:acyl-coenzyme A thioesterase PaaI-like protein
MTGAYIQEKLRPNHCFGCGPDNPYGLQIHSYWKGDEVVCRWTPEDYMTGPPNHLYGGISASLIDCHSVNAALAWANRQAGHEERFDPGLVMVTGTMTIKYLKPVPMKEVELRARVEKVEGRKYTVHTDLLCDGVPCVSGDVLAIRVERPQS